MAWKNNSTGVYDTKAGSFRSNKNPYVINGVSDILGIYNGRLLAIEVKRSEKAKRSQAQINFIEKIKEQGGIAGFAWNKKSVDDILGGINEVEELSS